MDEKKLTAQEILAEAEDILAGVTKELVAFQGSTTKEGAQPAVAPGTPLDQLMYRSRHLKEQCLDLRGDIKRLLETIGT
jgi:hypothetical protein